MSRQFQVISISYKTSSLQLREKIALNENECKALLLKIREVFGLSEALILSTCNRTEIYYVAEGDLSMDMLGLLASQKGISSDDLFPHMLAKYKEEETIAYLFEVATGLHSQVIGDLQLPNQIKNAYQWCADMQMAGPFLHRLMHSVFFVNKRVVQETPFRDGAASTSYATVETIESFLPLLNASKILVLGLGEIGKDVTRTLHDKGYSNFTVANRTKSKADALSKELAFDVIPLKEVKESIQNFDVVISSIQVDEPFIDKALLEKIEANNVKYFIDLSVPRSISTDIEQVPGMVLFDLDEIQSRASRVLENRKLAIPQVQEIIKEAIVDFDKWTDQMVVSPTIQKLKAALEQIRKEEMTKYMKSLTKEEARKMEKISSSMMQKVIKLPVLELKAACKRGEAETLIDVLNDLFNLEKVEALNK